VPDSSDMTSILGIDLAWRGDNPSAVSVAHVCGEHYIRITDIYPNISNWQEAFDNKIITKSTIGIAIDGPLIINNITGKRHCEKLLSRDYGGRGASCHATNFTLYPNHPGLTLSQYLLKCGFEHLNCRGKFQIECYPHIALIEIFALVYRLKYKRGSIVDRRDGQCNLSNHIMMLEQSSILKLTLAEEPMQLLKHDHIHSLRGRALKQNEDALDSIICAYIAGLFLIGFHSTVFGSATDGYIYVPNVRCI
jgi:predicted RNase H-like nuclease